MSSRIVGLLKGKKEIEERIRKLKPRSTIFDELLLRKVIQQIKEEEIKIEENLEKYRCQCNEIKRISINK